MSYGIFNLGENAATIDFGSRISLELNEKVVQLAEIIAKENFAGFVETVPAYASLTIFYDLLIVKKNRGNFPTAFAFVKNFLENSLEKLSEKTFAEPRLIEIPVDYGEKYAIDLDFVARNANLKRAEVIKIHSSQTYRVFMIGFLPAFAYMGEVDERIATPRKSSPRLKIEKGSVGIAGKQTGVYPLDSPGGWQIIGKTDVELFNPSSEPVSLLQTGDLVKFYPI